MACLNWSIHTSVLVLCLVFSTVPFVCGFTDPRDVYAIYQLHTSLGSPLLPNWVPGPQADPCGPPSWLGVECVNANITQINLSGANLGGRLSEDLGSFASIMILNLSNNHIGGPIPTNLPITLTIFDLSYNQFGGLIPDTLSSLGQLQKLSLKNNQLAGPIPDAFQSFTSLTSMDLSGNSLTNVLPSSMGSLSSLTTLHLQNNQLTGLLDVLQDLPLTDLNIENNLFSGPIPPKLLNIPDFRQGGNPFNTTIIPSPPSSPPSLAPSEAPASQYIGQVPVHGPPVPTVPTVYNVPSPPQETGKSGNKTTWIAIGGFLVVALLVLVLCVSVFRCCKTSRAGEKILPGGTHKRNTSWQSPFVQEQKASSSQIKTGFLKPGKDHSIDMTRSDNASPGPLPFPLLPAERVVVDPTVSLMAMKKDSTSKILESTQFFTVASLQLYTNSFSQENLIGKGTLGSVYRAQLPDGKVVAVKKLDKAATGHITDREFLDLVAKISKLHHENVVELIGYCLEHGQRLLVYNYCRNGTLDEALNFDDAINEKLSWNVRMRLALQAAKALEYLHEVCKPPIVHQNFKCCNVLLQDDLSVCVSDCGLAPLMSTNSIAQLQGSGYGAPELEFGSYSSQSDVYSFGVVLLRLLTGRKSHDRSRARGEQSLARWAFSRLHDIDALSRMVDPTMNGAYPSMSLSRVADIISLCIQPEPEFRLPMSEIVQKLQRIIKN
ncbi:Protein STRUBBELIG-RECEPTOR FAMILY 3 [Striga hermonthica]|uniref:Protein STRUBBELIG-RECEPTOR FAMILY 3 n=1 Tax=Striga hermonthica TaxID=68872 RepID=A0A9N7MWF1_STRHE|nr:Protein STRUBBELIG-RECEPTOR FAMILY 3 [Striga hermonthica]